MLPQRSPADETVEPYQMVASIAVSATAAGARFPDNAAITLSQHHLASIVASIGNCRPHLSGSLIGKKKESCPVRISVVMTIVLLQCAFSPAADAAPKQSLIPPVVLQGCSEKVNAAHSSWLVGGLIGRAGAGNAQGAQTVGFDVSFVNTSAKVANLVLVRVGQTEFAKTGTFSPNAAIAWRIAAKSGSECAVRAVRFDDGSEWDNAGT